MDGDDAMDGGGASPPRTPPSPQDGNNDHYTQDAAPTADAGVGVGASGAADAGAPSDTPPSSPLGSLRGAHDARIRTPPLPAAAAFRAPQQMPRTPPSPSSPMSPTSALSVSMSASAVSATEQPRYNFPEMSASIDATPTPRYLGRYGVGSAGMGMNDGGAAGEEEEDDVEAELRRMAQRQLPRGDLGRHDWRLDARGVTSSVLGRDSGAPSSPSMSVRSGRSDRSMEPPSSALPRPPASPPSSPRSRSRSRSRSQSNSVRSMSHVSASRTGAADASASRATMGSGGTDEAFSGAVVWGTNISVAESMGLVRMFLHHFRRPEQTMLDEPYYIQVLRHMALTQSKVFNLDTQHLLQHHPSRKLYQQLALFPQVLIRILDMVVNEEFRQLSAEGGDVDDTGAEEDADQLQVRPFNLSDLSPMRQLNPSDIDQLVCLKGMVTRCSAIIPDLKEAFFRCCICRATQQVVLDRGRIDEPTFCDHCNARQCMEMVHNRCAFTDKQMVKMQETPDAIPEGETPYTVMLFAFDDLVDNVRPGDKIEVTGIFRAVPMRTSSRQRVVKSVFKTYVDVVHFRRVDELARRGAEGRGAEEQGVSGDANDADELGIGEDGSLGHDANRIQATEEAKVAAFRHIASRPNVYQNLAYSLAPSIWELDDVKKGILCMLFGGTRKDKSATRPRPPGSDEQDGTEDPLDGQPNAQLANKVMRSDMNILLCGDPGTSKSQLLSYVHKLSPRSIYTSGKGSSAVGLTASIVRDMETGDLVLESGALVLSDEGICCIDEFDKMSDSARSVLHEVMEQQTVSIAKAGIICSLNARASILASANPVESRYNPNKSVIENVNILPTLLSRFDLIYLILDKPVAETDRQLAKHIVSLYFDEETRQQRQLERGDQAVELINMKLLTEYIAYAKKYVHPKLTTGARDALIRSYMELRRMGGGGASGGHGSTRRNITATPRQLESLIRISEALARMKLCSSVEEHDVMEALRLMNVATQRAAMDPRTGTIDMDMINTGHSSHEREAVAALIEAMKTALTDAPNQSLSVGELRRLIEEATKSEIKGNEFQAAIRSLEDDDLLQVSHGVVRFFGSATS